jgi:hypothetical protein
MGAMRPAAVVEISDHAPINPKSEKFVGNPIRIVKRYNQLKKNWLMESSVPPNRRQERVATDILPG